MSKKIIIGAVALIILASGLFFIFGFKIGYEVHYEDVDKLSLNQTFDKQFLRGFIVPVKYQEGYWYGGSSLAGYLSGNYKAFRMFAGEGSEYSRKDEDWTLSLEDFERMEALIDEEARANQIKFLTQFDENNDELLSSYEIQNATVVLKTFRTCWGCQSKYDDEVIHRSLQDYEFYNEIISLDANKDGDLSKVEMATLIPHYKEKTSSAKTFGIAKKYMLLDENSDEILTDEELLSGLRRIFNYHDLNKDGFVTARELRYIYEITPCKTEQEIEKDYGGDYTYALRCDYSMMDFRPLECKRDRSRAIKISCG